MNRLAKAALAAWVFFYAGNLNAYPLDGFEYTGITRLEGDRLVQQHQVKGRWLPRGALLMMADVDLRLLGRPDVSVPTSDPAFTRQIQSLLGDEATRYAVAVLDLSDLEHPRYAEHRGAAAHNPGSVGKLMIALGLFQTLADTYPQDITTRERVLRESQVTADQFIQTDHHKVPFWQPGDKKITYRPIREGDRASLWSYLDWMLSASSNAAASMSLREAMLLARFGIHYPPDEAQEQTFLNRSSKRELSALLSKVLHEPVSRNGLDSDELRQGGFFTWKGKRLVPGGGSRATPRMLVELLLKMEQGKLVDAFSSRELKRLLYMTERRIRYASAPELHNGAIYFKSGSLYRCKPEPAFECKKYQGNVDNLLNSVAIVEYPAGERRLYYMVALMSNVLRKNSAVVHQSFATRLHRIIEAYHQKHQGGR